METPHESARSVLIALFIVCAIGAIVTQVAGCVQEIGRQNTQENLAHSGVRIAEARAEERRAQLAIEALAYENTRK